MGKNSSQSQTPQAVRSAGKAAREAQPPPSPPLTMQEQIPSYSPHTCNQKQKSFHTAKVNIPANKYKLSTRARAHPPSIPPGPPSQWAYHQATDKPRPRQAT